MDGPDLPASERFARDVLDVVASIPPGRVMSYGQVAAVLGTRAARRVGRVLAESGADVPWWRVVRADGSPADAVGSRALVRLAEERTPLVQAGTRVDMAAARHRP